MSDSMNTQLSKGFDALRGLIEIEFQGKRTEKVLKTVLCLKFVFNVTICSS